MGYMALILTISYPIQKTHHAITNFVLDMGACLFYSVQNNSDLAYRYKLLFLHYSIKKDSLLSKASAEREATSNFLLILYT